MLSFRLTGTVGRIQAAGSGELVIAVASKRLVGHSAPEVEWVTCVARDPLLRAQITRSLRQGAIVCIEGEIEPRRREIKGVAFYDVVFVARWFEMLESDWMQAGP